MGGSSSPVEIYISSTFEDLAEYREAVHRELRELGADFRIVCMEEYCAQDGRPLGKCLDDVKRCLIYVGLFAMRYGYVPEADNPQGKSITELEYRQASTQPQTERLTFLSSETEFSLTPKSLERDPLKYQKLLALREELSTNHIAGFFTNKDNLAKQVRKAVEAAVRRRGGVEGMKLGAGPKTDAPKAPTVKRISTEGLPETSGKLFGREVELAELDTAWQHRPTNICCLTGAGGMGKSAVVNRWLARLAERDFDGAEMVFGWSFYSQEAEQQEASADLFVNEMYRFLGVPRADVPLDPRDKGRRLAELVQQRRTLLILDSLEPLQFATGEHEGRLKDPALLLMLKALALQNPGLVVITSRVHVRELQVHVPLTVRMTELPPLAESAGVELLQHLKVHGTPAEMAATVREYNGHPLLLELLGTFLRDVHFGDVTRRDDLDISEEPALRVLKGHEKLLGAGPALDLLRILGLFNRPAPVAAIDAVIAKPAIAGLTDHITGLSRAERNRAMFHLLHLKLLGGEDDGRPKLALEAHAVVRDHYSKVLRSEQPDAWKEANNRLFEYYRTSVPADLPETLEEMAPLFHAVTHGCRAGRFQEAWTDVEWRRIRREDAGYSVVNLGAWKQDLAALENFFDHRWQRPVPDLDGKSAAWLLTETAFNLRGLGRVNEAIPPLDSGLERHKVLQDWWAACDAAGNLSELLILHADLKAARTAAEESMKLALKAVGLESREQARGIVAATAGTETRKALVTLATNIATLAEVLHHQDKVDEAAELYREAEELFHRVETEKPCLRGMRGFHYCELLLDQGRFAEVIERSRVMERVDQESGLPFGVGLAVLARGKARLAQWTADNASEDLAAIEADFQTAIHILRGPGAQELLLRALLAAAQLALAKQDPAAAELFLQEVLERTRSGEIRLIELDAQLLMIERQLAGGDLTAAKKLAEETSRRINQVGYQRRRREIADLLTRCR